MASDSGSAGRVGTWGMFSLAFGVAVGVGWIVVAGDWLRLAGPVGASLAFAAAGLALLAIGMAYAWVAAAFPRAGGEYRYMTESFGPSAGFWTGWMLLFAYILVLAFEIVSIAWLLREFLGLPAATDGIDGPGLAGGAALLGLVFAANYRGGAAAARLQSGLVGLKIAGSVALVAAGLALGRPANLAPPLGSAPEGPLSGFLGVLAMAPFFFAGFGVVAQSVAAGSDPAAVRRLPWVMAAVIGTTLLFYIGVIFAVAAGAPRAALEASSLPSALAFSTAFGSPFGATLVVALGLVGLATVANGLFFAAMRLLEAIADDGLAPRRLGTGSGGRPAIFVALFAIGTAMLGKAAIGPLLTVASAAICYVMATVAAVLVRSASGRATARRTVGWLGLAVGAAMILLSLLEVARALRSELLLLVGWIALGAIFARPGLRAARA